MTNEEFEKIIGTAISRCMDTLKVKQGEYATEDRLHNFNVAARLLGCTPHTALAGMMAKHTVSVYDLIQRHEKDEHIPIELWREKIGDHINYLLLLTAMVEGEQAARYSGEKAKPDGEDKG